MAWRKDSQPAYYSVHRRRVFVVNGRLYWWKLRTLLVAARTISWARYQGEQLRQYPNEQQIVRRCRASLAAEYEGHQTKHGPAGVGLL